MNKPWQVIQELAGNNSRSFKESVIRREAQAGNSEFFEGCRLALDSLITFGIRQVPSSSKSGPGLPWQEFAQVAQQLINRELTGNNARQAVADLCSQATIDEWNSFYRLILIKDLRCGVTETTINKQVKINHARYMIPVFTCQLAQDSNEHPTHMTGVKQIDSKMDGTRCLSVVYPGGRVEQFSRNGKSLENFPLIKQQLAKTAEQLTEPWVFDGEIMSSSFQDLMRQLYRKSNVETTDAVLYLFDLIPLKAFLAGHWAESQRNRTQRLTQWHAQWAPVMPNVQILETELVDLDTSAGRDRMREINDAALAAGVEGIMIKNADAPYECKRGCNWLKLKPVIALDLTVVALEQGTGKNASSLGAIVCEGQHQGRTIQVNVGSGFTDAQRGEIWRNPQRVLGQVAEILADAVTQNQDGTHSLRFPRFNRWRGFAAGEKI